MAFPFSQLTPPADSGAAPTGTLEINVLSSAQNRPVENATIDISYTGDPEGILEEVHTDREGHVTVPDLPTPPFAYSQEPFAEQPYSEYTLKISAPGYEPIIINSSQLLPDVTAIQNITLLPAPPGDPNTAETFVIPANTLFGDFPPKIIESEVKPMAESGEIVLPNVVIPEYIVVHDGLPQDSSANNYYVPYRDYIKNVASSEIYATWPTQTIIANVLAIQSFTLNRVYTEWYRSKGYNFTITSSTAYDHKWVPERNIFDTIDRVVDDIFNFFLSRPNIKQPILTQYCDGKRVTCPGLMSQWGSKTLGDQGLSAAEILRTFYGSSIYINETNLVSGVPVSFPGTTLSIGSSGPEVRQLQEQLAEIADVYYSIPSLAVDGIYGPGTAASVTAFQEKFDLPVTGQVDQATWYKISAIYVAVTRIAEYA